MDEEIQALQSDISQTRTSADALAELAIRELVGKVGKLESMTQKAQPRLGERLIANIAKEGTFGLLEQLPEDLVALIVSGDRDGTIGHHVIGHTQFVNDEGEMQRLTEKESGKLVRLAETVRKARAVEAGERGTGWVKSVDVPYEPPTPDYGPFTGPVMTDKQKWESLWGIKEWDLYGKESEDDVSATDPFVGPPTDTYAGPRQPDPDPITNALNALIDPNSARTMGAQPPMK